MIPIRRICAGVLVLSFAGCVFDTSGLPVDDASVDRPQADLAGAEDQSRDRRLDTPAMEAPKADTVTDTPPPDKAVVDQTVVDQVVVDTAPACPTACMLGCKPGTATCRAFLPSNVGSAVAPASCTSLTLDNTGIDTTGCTAQSCNGKLVPAGTPAYCLIVADSLTVKQTVKVTGQYPLVISVKGTIQIASGAVLDASASGTVPGPGGWTGGKPPAADQPQQGQGPGAGKHCTCQSDLYEGRRRAGLHPAVWPERRQRSYPRC